MNDVTRIAALEFPQVSVSFSDSAEMLTVSDSPIACYSRQREVDLARGVHALMYPNPAPAVALAPR